MELLCPTQRSTRRQRGGGEDRVLRPALIAIALCIISASHCALFVDDTLPLPGLLEVHDLDDLKGNLVKV
jgi:hypothetical protein